MPIGDAVQEIFLVNLFWNFQVFYIQVYKLLGCNYIGLWGLFWFNDNGEMTNNCLKTGIQGAMAEFITSWRAPDKSWDPTKFGPMTRA